MQKTNSLRPYPTALLNPRSDPTFKALFTQNTPKSNDALRDFIATMIGEPVQTVALLPNEPPVKMQSDKQMAFDVHCVLASGEPVEIEMQGHDKEHSYSGRAEAHAARLLAHATRKGSLWKDISKVYQISVLNFTYDNGDKSAFSWYTMRKKAGGRNEDEQGLTLKQRLNVIYLELPKIRKLAKRPAETLTKIERWGIFLAYADNPEMQDYLRGITMMEESIMNANNVLEEISVDEANWYLQNAYDDWERDQLSFKNYLAELEANIKQLQHDVEQKQRDVKQQQREVEQQQHEVEQQQRDVEQKQRDVQQQQRDVQQQQREVEQQQHDVEQKQRDVEQKQRDVQQQQQKLAQAEQKLVSDGEHQRAVAIAQNLIRNGKLSTAEIADITQLSAEEVRQLQKDLPQ